VGAVAQHAVEHHHLIAPAGRRRPDDVTGLRIDFIGLAAGGNGQQTTQEQIT
jgi:hypothetical protein